MIGYLSSKDINEFGLLDLIFFPKEVTFCSASLHYCFIL